MSINFPLKVVNYVIGNFSPCGKKMMEFKNEIIKFQAEINEKIYVIPLLPLLGVNYRKLLLHMSKGFLY